VANKKAKISNPLLESSLETALLPLPTTSDLMNQVQSVIQRQGFVVDASSPAYSIPGQASFRGRAPPPISLIPRIPSPISLNPGMYSGLPSPSPSESSDSSTSKSLKRLSDTPDYQSQADFDLGVSTAAFAVLDDVHTQFERMTTKYFHSVHTYLTFIHQPRFQKRVEASRIKADAEMSVLLLSMKLVAEPVNYALSGADPRQNPVYTAAKQLHRLVRKTKGPSLDLIQSGILLCLYEHNAAIGDLAYKTLGDCASMAQVIGLNASDTRIKFGIPNPAAYQEECRRTYWGLVSMDW
jgi:hypothetical protein